LSAGRAGRRPTAPRAPCRPAGRELARSLDQAQIELLRGLDDGEGAVLAEIIDQYLAQTVEGHSDLVRVTGEGDAQGLVQVAHKLRGASANVGAVVLAEICSELEAQGRAGRLEAPPAWSSGSMPSSAVPATP